MSQHQPRTKAGKYDTFEHGTGGVSLGAPAGSAAEQSRARYRELMDRRWDYETEATVHAAAAVASATREMFPDARYVTFTDNSYQLEPDAVLDSGLNVIASRRGDLQQREAFDTWSGEEAKEGDYDVSVTGLATGLGEHGGKLDGVLVKPHESARHDAVLDIDQALSCAERSSENLASGIVSPAAFEDPA